MWRREIHIVSVYGVIGHWLFGVWYMPTSHIRSNSTQQNRVRRVFPWFLYWVYMLYWVYKHRIGVYM
jgi:hypothetical protein